MTPWGFLGAIKFDVFGFRRLRPVRNLHQWAIYRRQFIQAAGPLTKPESNEIIGSCFSDEGSLYCTPHHPTSKLYANYDFSLDETMLDK